MVDALDGSRFEALLPPVVEGPAFSIRKRAICCYTMKDYLQSGSMDQRQMEILHDAIVQCRNILVVGGTGSGKTTLTNALIAALVEIAPAQRLVIIEDTREIQCAAANYVQLKTSDTKDMNSLLRATLRLRPDRIVVGEVRGAEAMALLKSWNTGHPGGIATLHANNAHGALTFWSWPKPWCWQEGTNSNSTASLSKSRRTAPPSLSSRSFMRR